MSFYVTITYDYLLIVYVRKNVIVTLCNCSLLLAVTKEICIVYFSNIFQVNMLHLKINKTYRKEGNWIIILFCSFFIFNSCNPISLLLLFIYLILFFMNLYFFFLTLYLFHRKLRCIYNDDIVYTLHVLYYMYVICICFNS